MKKVSKLPIDIEVLEHRGDHVYLRFYDLTEVDLESIYEQARVFSEICEGYRYPFIVDTLDQTIRVNHEVRDFIVEHNEEGHVLAEAFVLNNESNKLLFKFFMKFHKPGFPVKIFSNLEDAEAWVKQFKPEKI